MVKIYSETICRKICYDYYLGKFNTKQLTFKYLKFFQYFNAQWLNKENLETTIQIKLTQECSLSKQTLISYFLKNQRDMHFKISRKIKNSSVLTSELYANPQSRATHWSKSKTCKEYHRIQRVEDLLQNLECLGCGDTFDTLLNCHRHMNESAKVEISQIPKKETLYDEKVLNRWNYGNMKFLKQQQDPNQSHLKLPEFVFEVKGGYICQKWVKFFRQQFRCGLPIKMRSDVRNDYLWDNLRATMLKVNGCLFKIVVQDNPWKGQNELPYHYLSIKSLRQIPLKQIQQEGIIFYWTLFNTQNDGLKILKQQGYEVVKTQTWFKYTNLGNPINSKSPQYSKEYCLIGIKGSLYKNMIDRIQDEIHAKRREHSEKPEEFWNMIVELFGMEYRLEIFTRSNSNRMHTVHIWNEIEGEEELRIKNYKQLINQLKQFIQKTKYKQINFKSI
ncbi:MT-A70 family protein [Oxytricha trifallax]|uniref:mRNA m(6)A methyltransferase n=1 Tax=Oxytricha trifallax TaxID=1172189 RepID=A0A073I002_9SPIT|nr:MT-A70 family protein [Oxytricha trifallax]